jgi:hypothetical protein
MQSQYAAPDLAILDTADRIARVAYLWLRQRAVSSDACGPLNGQLDGQRRTQLLIAGFIFELCGALQLTAQHGLLAAYAYALLDGSDSNSLDIATILFDARTVPQTSIVFEEGRSMVGEMLGLLENSGLTAAPDYGFDPPPARFAC